MIISEHKAYLLIKLFITLLGQIPLWLSLIIANKIGQLWFLIDKKHREITLENLTYAFSDSMNSNEIEQLAKKIFKNIAKIIFEIAWVYNLNIKDFPKYFTVEGIENLHKAAKKDKGVLILTAHTGNWELGVIATSLTGYPASAVYRPLDYQPLEKMILEIRQRTGMQMFPLGEARKTVIENLNKKMAVTILLDQGVDWYKGVYVNFFNRLACTNKGMAVTALMTDAPVLPLFCYRDKDKDRGKDRGKDRYRYRYRYRYKLFIAPEIPLVRTGDKTKDIEINTQNYATVTENFIRRYPDQWFWVHNRWKYKPYCEINI